MTLLSYLQVIYPAQVKRMGNLFGAPMLVYEAPVVHEPVNVFDFGHGFVESTTTARDGTSSTTVSRHGQVIATIFVDVNNNAAVHYYGGLPCSIVY